MPDLFQSIVAGATVEVETALSPPLNISVAGDGTAGDGRPPLFVRLLRPRVTVRENGRVVFKVEPAGAPDAKLRVLLLLGVAFALFLLVRRLAR